MRNISLIKGDIRFQYKYGFYYLYIILTFLYLLILSLLSATVKEKTGLILIFTDPATMGLFFMGAIVLLEKSQRVISSLAVSPVTVHNYILSKVISIGLVSVIVGGILAIASLPGNLFIILAVLLYSSALFTLAGLIIGANIRSINQYIVATVPVELFGFFPIVLYLLDIKHPLLYLHPCYIAICFLDGRFDHIFLCVAVAVIWLLGLICLASIYVKKMFMQSGGVSL